MSLVKKKRKHFAEKIEFSRQEPSKRVVKIADLSELRGKNPPKAFFRALNISN